MASFVFSKRNMSVERDFPLVFKRDPARCMFYDLHIEQQPQPQQQQCQARSPARAGAGGWRRKRNADSPPSQTSGAEDLNCIALSSIVGPSLRRAVFHQCSFGFALGAAADDVYDAASITDPPQPPQIDLARFASPQLEWLDISECYSVASGCGDDAAASAAGRRRGDSLERCLSLRALPSGLRVLILSKTRLSVTATELFAALATAPLLEKVDATRCDVGGKLDLSAFAPRLLLLEQLLLASNSIGPTCVISNGPPSLRRVALSNNKIKIWPDLKNLPPRLERLDISKNCILEGGPVDLRALPQSLEQLLLDKMRLVSLAAAAAPCDNDDEDDDDTGIAADAHQQLWRLTLAKNGLSRLPERAIPLSVQVLDVSENALTRFPEFLLLVGRVIRHLDISNNRLIGTFPAAALAAAPFLRHLDCSHNAGLTGDLSQMRLPAASIVHVDFSGCDFFTPERNSVLFDDDGCLPLRECSRLTDMHLNDNKRVCGSIRLSAANLPHSLERLSVRGCSLSALAFNSLVLARQSQMISLDVSCNRIVCLLSKLLLCPTVESLNLADNQFDALSAVDILGADALLDCYEVDYSRNRFSFELHDFDCVSPELRKCNLADNKNLRGNVSDPRFFRSFARLGSMRLCTLDGNALTGAVTRPMLQRSIAAGVADRATPAATRQTLSLTNNAAVTCGSEPSDGEEFELQDVVVKF